MEETKNSPLLDEENLIRCITTAKELGCPKEQTTHFLSAAYAPYKWQWQFHSIARKADLKHGPTKIGVGGSRGPGKSHSIFAQCTLDDCQRVPNLKGLFLRQTGRAAKESMEDLVTKILAKRVAYELSGGVVKFGNGSKLMLGGFKDDKDIDKYIGIEYDFMAIEEVNQLTENKVMMLLGSMRTAKPDWRPRLYCSFNPGGTGHGFAKKTFVEPHRSGTEKDTAFIPATYNDNPNLNDEYRDYLEALPGQLGKAWREGDFDIMAGQYFTEWNHNVHVVEPFEIPEGWTKFASMDYGYEAPSAILWYAVDPDGKVYIYRELYKTGLTYSMLADEFATMTTHNEKISYLVCDPSIWNKDGRSDGGISGAEIFETRYREVTGRGIQLERGNNDRIQGWGVVREFLRVYKFGKEEKITSKLQIFENCYNLIRTIPLQIHDDKHPEDLDTTLDDHIEDSLRYGLMSKPKPKITNSEIEDRIFRDAMKRKRAGSRTGKFMSLFRK